MDSRSYDDEYLSERNQVAGGEWAFIEGSETVYQEDKKYSFAGDDYRAMYAFYEDDLHDGQIWSAFTDMVDVENLLRHYAIYPYLGIHDWPNNNTKMYRYYGMIDDRADIAGNKETAADGRWRYMFIDADELFTDTANTPGIYLLQEVLGFAHMRFGESLLFRSLLGRDDVQGRYIAILCDLMNYHFAPQMIEDMMRRRVEEQSNEMAHYLHLRQALDIEPSDILAYMDFVIEQGYARPIEMRGQIETYMEIPSSGYDIFVQAHPQADIALSTIDIREGEDFTGWYYDVCELPLSASCPPGYVFSHWLVNGEERYEEELIVGKDDAADGFIGVELILKPDEHAVPIVTLIDYKENSDCIEIHNPFNENIDLSRYFISDDPAAPYKQILAGRILRPGESISVYCRNYRTYDTLGNFSLDFNLKDGETLTITSTHGEEVFACTLPKMDNDYVLAMDMRNGKYRGKLR